MILKKDFFKNNSIAQGTIEYLVVIAVVVVLSLVVVALVINVSSSPSQQISSSSDKAGNVAVGGISIVEAVSDLDGDSLIMLSNNSSEGITLKKITVGENDNNYDDYIGGVDSVPISLTGLASSCPCESGQKSVKCEFVFEYLTKSGLTQIERRTINVQCTNSNNNPTPSNPNRVIEPIIVIKDNISPIITLTSPLDDSVEENNSVSFTFSVEENLSIDSCTLNVGSDSNTYTGIEIGENTIVYTFDNDKLLDWNISCVDSFENTGVSSSNSLNVDFNLYQIKTCLELQDMNTDLYGNYVLLNSIDCSSDTSGGGALYNGGLGFSPIGAYLNPFEGTLDGNNFTISGLNITRPLQDNVGLFASSSRIYDLNLSNVNIVGRNNTGGLSGISSGVGDTLININVSGIVIGNNAVGGIVGFFGANLDFSGGLTHLSSNTNVSGNDYVGGLVGSAGGASIDSSFSLNSVSGNSNVGGLVGSISGANFSGAGISNSYSRAEVSGLTEQAIGGLIGSFGTSSLGSTSLYNSYSSGLVSIIDGGLFFSGEEESSKLSFSILPPTPDSNVGGLIGLINYNANNIIESSYWDMNSSGQENSAGEGNGVVGKTTTQMKQQSTFAGWDFDSIWTITEGVSYPELR